jgi:uncharacterized protein
MTDKLQPVSAPPVGLRRGGGRMGMVAVVIVCKTPIPGRSKTRLSPPLRPSECAELSACFIQDLSRTIADLADEGDVAGHALYTPLGSEAALRRLLPKDFALTPQYEGEFGDRLLHGVTDLLEQGYQGAILVNSDSPTLPRSILRAAVDAVRRKDCVVLSPAFDGGYTLIGLSKPHARLFQDIPWSTDAVYDSTLERAHAIGLPVIDVPGWYDIDDASSLRMLERELLGRLPRFVTGADAPATRRFFDVRRAARAEPAAVAV